MFEKSILKDIFKHYYDLAKPGMVYGNTITTAAGFFLASRGHPHFGVLAATLVGISFIVAAACVFNNYLERDIDAKMERTKNRALVVGVIQPRSARIYGIILGAIGVGVLALFTNILTLAVAFVGFFFYIVMYTVIFKHRSVQGTIVGSIAGATPIVVGYVAASNRLDVGAVILFLILALWQMPHFYAIAIRRLDEYAAAGIPVLPVKSGVHATKIQMLFYIAAFTIAAVSLTIFGFAGYFYGTVAALLGFTWLGLCIKGFWAYDDKLWARKMFKLSLVIIIVLCVMMAIDVVAR